MNTHNDLIEKHFSSITAENEMNDAWDVVNEAITDSNDPDHIYRHKDYDKKMVVCGMRFLPEVK